LPTATVLGIFLVAESQGTVDVLLASVLRLLHNLAFDEEQRLQMVNCGLIPKVTVRFTRPYADSRCNHPLPSH